MLQKRMMGYIIKVLTGCYGNTESEQFCLRRSKNIKAGKGGSI